MALRRFLSPILIVFQEPGGLSLWGRVGEGIEGHVILNLLKDSCFDSAQQDKRLCLIIKN